MKTTILISLSLFLYGASSQSTACLASQYFDGSTCVNYANPADKMSSQPDATIDTGNTAWVLSATALVMLMTPAIGLLYAGLYKQEHATNTILLSFVSLAVISVEWILFGYSFAFGPGSKGYGNYKWGVFHHVAAEPSGVYATKIPHILYAVFQNMFATMTPAFLSGAVVGRMKFGTYIVYIIAWTLVVYNCLAHWNWGAYIDPNTWISEPLGWLAIRGTIDYAGGGVIHITSGFAALASAIILGKRDDYKKEPIHPHNMPLVAIGLTLLWVGWFGYTGGSAGAANGVASFALVNTQIAASVGMIFWLILENCFDKKTSLVGAAYGAMAGLVAITPAAGYVWPWHSLIFGIFASAFGFLFSKLKFRLRYDDPFDVFAIHGICGSVGMFMTGLFATSEVNPSIQGGAFYGDRIQLGYQMAGIVVAAAFSFVCTSLILWILKKTIGLRVTKRIEDTGLDLKYHGGPAYYFEEPVKETPQPEQQQLESAKGKVVESDNQIPHTMDNVLPQTMDHVIVNP